MYNLTIKVGGKEVVLQGQTPAQRLKAEQLRARADDSDNWPGRARAQELKPVAAPPKSWTKRRGKATNPNATFAPHRGVGVGSNTSRGYRAYAGMIRAIAAEGTGAIAWDTGTNRTVERRLRRHMRATTKRDQTGMQVVKP